VSSRNVFGLIIMTIFAILLLYLRLRTGRPLGVLYKEYGQKLFIPIEAAVLILAIIIFSLFFIVNNYINKP
jgi:hypothetical protein